MAAKTVRDAIRLSRRDAVMKHYKSVGMKISRENALQQYLESKEYRPWCPDWMDKCPRAWRDLCEMWASKEWIERSKRNRENRDANPNICVTYLGGRGMGHVARDIESEMGLEPDEFTVCRQAHMPRVRPDGTQPPMPPAAQEKIDTYSAAMKKHSANCDPLTMPVDPLVIYNQFGGRSHGRLGFMDFVVAHDSYRGQVRAHRQQATSSSRAQLEAQAKLIVELQQQRQVDEQRWQAEEQRRQAEREDDRRRYEALQSQNLSMFNYMQSLQGAGPSCKLQMPPSPPFFFTQMPGTPTTKTGAPSQFMLTGSFPMYQFTSALAASPGVSALATAAPATNAPQGGDSSGTRSAIEQFVNDLFTDPFTVLQT